MAREPQVSSAEIAHITRVGTKSVQPNGDIVHTSRTNSAPDHLITVTTRNGRVMSARAIYSPLQTFIRQSKKEEHEIKSKPGKTKTAQKRQLDKKRARTPKPKNKQNKPPKRYP